MAAKEFPLQPVNVEPLETPYRKIATAIPHPDSIELIQALRRTESRSMRGQPPVIWHRAVGLNIEDAYGNRWLDWSSGVLVTNAGHNHPKIRKAISEYLQSEGPLFTYCFPNEPRKALAEKLVEVAPDPLDRVFLLTTGAESTEVAMKLARTHGVRKDPKKRYIISFAAGFHGRTYGAQLAGGVLGGAEWVDPNPYFIQVPFPGSIDTQDKSFAAFERVLEEKGVHPDEVAGFIGETFQGREAKLMPVEYVHQLRQWCTKHDVVMIFDEVQAGFGRTGKMFAFEHYGVVPDLVCCGKGISSSLPLSCVIGRQEIMDLYGPGEMTSTHTGSPLPCVASLANIEAMQEEGMLENAAEQGAYLIKALTEITEPWRDRIDIGGVGLVIGMLFMDNRQNKTPDPETAFAFCRDSFLRGNLFFAPVGKNHGCIKFCPALNITRDAIEDALYGPGGIKEVLEAVMNGTSAVPSEDPAASAS